jgi:3-hydroxybutyrate dehydrogenase
MSLASITSRPLEGRHALITGSSDGLGLAMAQGLAAAGCHVTLHGLVDSSQMQTVCEQMRHQHQVRVHYIPQDLSHRAGVLSLHDHACTAMGSVDILLNNAVVRHFGPIETLAYDDWQQALAVNLTAAFGLIQCVLPGMRAAGYGRLIQMTSVYGQRGTVDRVDYVTTKTALIGLTRAAAAETVSDGITSNAICPGSVLTPGTDTRVLDLMRDHRLDRAAAEAHFLQGKQPSKRFVHAADVAASVVYLCSQAARDISGQVMSLDGGWSAL